jgi:hypothetical protein
VTSGVKVVQGSTEQRNPSINIMYQGSQVSKSFNHPQGSMTRVSQSQYNSNTSGVYQAGIPQQQIIRPAMNIYPGVPSHIGPQSTIINHPRQSNVNINLPNINMPNMQPLSQNVVQSLNRGPIIRY